MEEVGVVKGVQGRMATVSIERKAVCDQCTSGTCSVSAEGAKLEAVNTIGAKVGDKVRVSLKAYSFIKGSIIVYVFPAMSLVAGAIVGKEYFADRFPSIDPEGVSALFGFGAFLLSFLVVRFWGMRTEKKTEYRPVIEEILKD